MLGVTDPLVEENRLANMVMNGVSPLLVPEIEAITVADKLLLVARVYPAGLRPFHVTAEGPDQGVYVRLGSSNVQADQWTIAELHRQSEGYGFDQMPNHHDRLGLDDDAIAKALPDRDVELAKTVLRLTAEDQGTTVPTNGGVLLFGRLSPTHSSTPTTPNMAGRSAWPSMTTESTWKASADCCQA